MQPYPFGFVLDTAQTRIAKGGDKVQTIVNGDEWDKQFRTAYVEPVNACGMLMPYPLTPEWSTTFTGNYSRYRLSDYSGITAANWVEAGVTDDTDGFIKWNASTGDPEGVHAPAQPRNGSMWLGWYAANSDAQRFVQMECGWGSGSTSDPLSLRFYSDGQVEVWRSGVMQGVYTYTGSGTTQEGFPSSTAHQYVYVILMPYRKRELLVLSNRGGGFSYLFEDIDETVDDPEITPAGPFWWRVPSGMAQAACAPCKFNTAGYLVGTQTTWQRAPKAGSSFSSHVYGETHGGGGNLTLCQLNNPASTWSPDGSSTDCRVKVNLSGNGIRTPHIYGATAWYETRTASTPDESTALDAYVVKASLEVGDSATDAKVTLDLIRPDELDGGIAPRILSVSNRPFTLKYGAISVLTGATEPTKYTEGLDDWGRRLHLEVRDKWKALEHYTFTDPTPLDGVNLADAFRFILRTAGVPVAQIDVQDVDFTLPTAEGCTRGDYAVCIQAGDSAADWLTRLHENYCATWFLGFVPTPSGTKFRLWSPERLGSASVYTLYDNTDDALAAGATLGNRHALTYRSYNDTQLEPEANSIYVMGRDPRSGKPILAYRDDLASQDPTTPRASRPDNWLGDVRKYGLIDASIATYEAAARAVDILSDRLTPSRLVAEFESDFLVKADGTPVWRGDVVTLDGYGDYRIKALSTEIKKDYDTQSGWYWRPTRYTAERIGDPSAGLSHHGGFSLEQLIELYKHRAVSKSVVRDDQLSRDLLNVKPVRAYSV